jgi:ribosomal protein S18 acetylase RimI-like enzyme
MQTLPIRYRIAIDADAEQLADMYLEARKTLMKYAPLAHDDDEVRRWVKTVLLPEHEVWVAQTDATIVGMMATAPGWIEQMMCKPGYTNQGIGTALLNIAKERAAEQLDLYTFQPNAGARRFYERHGFTAVEFGDGADNEEGVPDVLYRWVKEPLKKTTIS